ncbi:type II toxin-antitoxin system RelE/ParE family toxin [Emticicia sp. 21SJ11W-3]|uniref:type II toxin-antitoxin system RelE/ParE family toxin n=1 Tax=Emticicia sp. 21SJ11W-3 TaxID=2916755 RepID=UPI00209EDD9D|nr:type II toxin-antitoxin system RelE/ParE family toxin [Emticicia sp. 21SJ11W-3]UTA68430.1 type II toxin-antitoxin system RelE/ParE family toxin [Emticicia sp. 21SJ11W-3]
MSEYRISQLAQQDLEDIWDYTIHEWSREQADKYIEGILASFNSIANGHAIGKPIDYVLPGYKKALYGKHYIFYRISSEGITEIIRISHVSIDVKNRL